MSYDLVIAYLDIYMREFKIKVHTKMCTWIFIAAFFLIAPDWEWHRGPSMGEWMNKLWYIHTMEHYSAAKGTHNWYTQQSG